MKNIPISHYLSGSYRKEAANQAAQSDVLSREKEGERKVWFEQGFEAGRLAAKQDFERTLQAERQKLASHVAAARISWTETEGNTVVRAVIQAIYNLETKIAAKVANVLKPFVKSEALEQALKDLSKSLHTLTTNNKNIQLKITGPEDFVTEIKKQIPETITLSVEGSSQLSVVVETGETVIETNIDEWFQKLEVLSRAQK